MYLRYKYNEGATMQATAQVLPEEKLALDEDGVKGRRFGELTALHIVENYAGRNVWMLQCTCGRYAQRPLSQIRASMKAGHSPMCHECRDELYRGMILDGREHRKSKRATDYETYGTLWSEDSLQILQEDIRKEMQKVLGAWTPETEEPEDEEEEEEKASALASDFDPHWEEGFKKPPERVLAIPWINETPEERADRLFVEDLRAVELRTQAAARKEAQRQKLLQKKELEQQAAAKELQQLKDKARTIIKENIAAKVYNTATAATELPRSSTPSLPPACFGIHFSTKEPDCVGSTKCGTSPYKPACDLHRACKIRSGSSATMPPCFGKSFSATAVECLGRTDVPECDAWKGCKENSQQHLVQLRAGFRHKREEGDTP
jgi:hypothetical protein